MRCLVHIIPLIAGDIVHESHPEHYECFLMLHDIVASLLSPLFVREQVPYLQFKIEEYLMAFSLLYNRRLTPKFHYLVHIPRSITRYDETKVINKIILSKQHYLNRMGPPVRHWCMRMEAKHKQIKKWAQTTSYKALCWTLAVHHQQCASYALSSSSTFSSSHAIEHQGICIYSNKLTKLMYSNKSKDQRFSL